MSSILNWWWSLCSCILKCWSLFSFIFECRFLFKCWSLVSSILKWLSWYSFILKCWSLWSWCWTLVWLIFRGWGSLLVFITRDTGSLSLESGECTELPLPESLLVSSSSNISGSSLSSDSSLTPSLLLAFFSMAFLNLTFFWSSVNTASGRMPAFKAKSYRHFWHLRLVLTVTSQLLFFLHLKPGFFVFWWALLKNARQLKHARPP